MKISTIIVTYNALRNGWLYKCIASLQNSTTPTDVIVIDNASSDATVAEIKLHFPNVKLIASEENLGFGKANNIGIEHALKNNTDYFFLLNQDAWVEDDTIEKLANAFQKYTGFGVISPLHLTGDGSTLDLLFSKCLTPGETPDILADALLGKEKEIYEGRANAAAWMLSRDCVKTVGGFNPTFFHYGEDSNYFHRLKFHHLKLGILTTTHIYHDRQYRKQKTDWREEKKRMELLRLSNPNMGSLDKKKFMLRKQTKILKKIISFNFAEASAERKQFDFFQNNWNSIHQNNQIIKAKKEYAFLNVN